MIHTTEIYLWGTRIGILHLEKGLPYAAFEYDRDFIKSGTELSPLSMPLSCRVYEFPSLANEAFHGVPGMVADSLPDKFGNAVINRWLAEQGKTEKDFNVIDRLCYTGSRGMGALEYVPANGPSLEMNDIIDVSEMVRFASEVLNERKQVKMKMSDELAYSQLLQLGTSAGGARAKAIIAWNRATNEIRSGQIDAESDFEHWLIKFDGITNNGDHGKKDSPEYTLIEYAYYQMAIDAGIVMNECQIYSENGRNHFMTKRFDRVLGKKLHMQTLGAIAHINYNIPGLCSYEQAAMYMMQMNLPASDIEQFYRRMVFNVLAVNQDDHVKNISFLMDKNGTWKLSPAYDVTFAYDIGNKWLSSHQMLIQGKSSDISYADLLQCGKMMDISTQRCKRMISEVQQSVCRWIEFADVVGIREKTAVEIQRIMEENKIDAEV